MIWFYLQCLRVFRSYKSDLALKKIESITKEVDAIKQFSSYNLRCELTQNWKKITADITLKRSRNKIVKRAARKYRMPLCGANASRGWWFIIIIFSISKKVRRLGRNAHPQLFWEC
jgi:hypothetical protein